MNFACIKTTVSRKQLLLKRYANVFKKTDKTFLLKSDVNVFPEENAFLTLFGLVFVL